MKCVLFFQVLECDFLLYSLKLEKSIQMIYHPPEAEQVWQPSN